MNEKQKQEINLESKYKDKTIEEQRKEFYKQKAKELLDRNKLHLQKMEKIEKKEDKKLVAISPQRSGLIRPHVDKPKGPVPLGEEERVKERAKTREKVTGKKHYRRHNLVPKKVYEIVHRKGKTFKRERTVYVQPQELEKPISQGKDNVQGAGNRGELIDPDFKFVDKYDFDTKKSKAEEYEYKNVDDYILYLMLLVDKESENDENTENKKYVLTLNRPEERRRGGILPENVFTTKELNLEEVRHILKNYNLLGEKPEELRDLDISTAMPSLDVNDAMSGETHQADFNFMGKSTDFDYKWEKESYFYKDADNNEFSIIRLFWKPENKSLYTFIYRDGEGKEIYSVNDLPLERAVDVVKSYTLSGEIFKEFGTVSSGGFCPTFGGNELEGKEIDFFTYGSDKEKKKQKMNKIFQLAVDQQIEEEAKPFKIKTPMQRKVLHKVEFYDMGIKKQLILSQDMEDSSKYFVEVVRND